MLTESWRIWIGTNRGLARLSDGRIEPISLATNGKPTPEVTSMFEDPQGVLWFSLMDASFSAPEKVRFKYKLQGLDKDWIDAANRREAYYTNLSPGTYQFSVIACNNDGLWVPEQAGAVTTLFVRPHFYQTLWFCTLCAAAFIAAIWLLWRWRLQQILEERTRLSRELYDTVARGAVALIWRIEQAKSEVEKKRFDTLTARLDNAAKLARESLRETRRALRALRSGILDADRCLSSALEAVLAGMTESTRLYAELKVSGTPYRIGPAWEQALVRITQESLTNTLKYAQAHRFEAELRYSRREVRLRLSDDGIGFDYKPGGGSNCVSTGSLENCVSGGPGLLGIEERCRQLGGRTQIESSPGSGTTIEIILPCRRLGLVCASISSNEK